MIKTQDYRLGILKGIYINCMKNLKYSMVVTVKTRMEALAYRHLQKRGFIKLERELSDELGLNELRLKIILLQSGIDYIHNLENKSG
jgi:hypothetical protein